MNITADGLATATPPIDLALKTQALRDLLQRIATAQGQQRRQDLQHQLDQLVDDVRHGLAAPR